MKGLIFDMDGTMIDNMMIHHRAWQRKLASLGVVMTLEEVKDSIHGVNVEILKRLFGDRFTDAERLRISSEKEAEYRQIYAPNIQLINGLEAFLEEAKSANIPMAIGTAAPAENAFWAIEKLGLDKYFSVVVHAGDVSKGKPDPEVFQKAANGIGVPLKDCLVFEDSITGAKAAQNGGCSAIIVTTTHAEEEFSEFLHILEFITDFKNISLKALKPK